MEYRKLTTDEIAVLESNCCWAEDWQRVTVAVEGWAPKFYHRVMFYGDIRLGKVEKNIEISAGFEKHSGINDATLRNVSVGDNCLIEKTGNYINNYTIGNDCYIANISQMEPPLARATSSPYSTRWATATSSSSTTSTASLPPSW